MVVSWRQFTRAALAVLCCNFLIHFSFLSLILPTGELHPGLPLDGAWKDDEMDEIELPRSISPHTSKEDYDSWPERLARQQERQERLDDKMDEFKRTRSVSPHISKEDYDSWPERLARQQERQERLRAQLGSTKCVNGKRVTWQLERREPRKKKVKKVQCDTCKQKLPYTQMKKCSRCRCATYCGVQCQRIAWPEHKAHCVRRR